MCVCVCVLEAWCMNSCMGGVQPAWSGGGDMGSWLACLLVKLLVEFCILALYYIGYTLSGQIIMRSEIITIWPLNVQGTYRHLESLCFLLFL